MELRQNAQAEKEVQAGEAENEVQDEEVENYIPVGGEENYHVSDDETPLLINRHSKRSKGKENLNERPVEKENEPEVYNDGDFRQALEMIEQGEARVTSNGGP